MGEAGRAKFANAVYTALCAAPLADSFDALNEVVAPASEQLGFICFAAVEVTSIPGVAGLNFLFGQPDLDWCDTYRREGLAACDPRIRHILSSSEPALMSEISGDRGRGDILFAARMREFGHGDCFVWPVHLPEGRARAVLMWSSLEPVRPMERIAVGALAGAFYAAGSRLLRHETHAETAPVELRPRQVQCLYWARQGKSSADIGRIIGISARTVDEHLANACEILGVRSRIQAVARAVVIGLV